MKGWSYDAARHRIIDENGLGVAVNVLPDDAARILEAMLACRLLVDALRVDSDGESVEWSDIDDAGQAALRALGELDP